MPADQIQTESLRYPPLAQHFNVPFQFSVLFTAGVFETDNLTLLKALKSQDDSKRHRVLPVVDSEVLRCHPELLSCIRVYFKHHISELELIDDPLEVAGGEQCKDNPVEVQALLERTLNHRIDRHSYVMIIGGGAVLDAMGYACAIAHRGVRVIRLPTTVLAQNDAGIGVKNAINFKGRKNYIGTFAPPALVINDRRFLATLEARDKRSGIAEAIKVSLIRDREFFLWLERHADRLADFETESMQTMIYECARLHLQHITGSGDPFEMGSARPLDFGHWCAHRLEELGDTSDKLRHGEAVAIGIALDSIYSARLNDRNQSDGQESAPSTNRFLLAEADRVVALLLKLGFTLQHASLAELDIEQALEHFREHLGGKLCITLLKDFGRAEEVERIDIAMMKDAASQLLSGQMSAKDESFSSIGVTKS